MKMYVTTRFFLYKCFSSNSFMSQNSWSLHIYSLPEVQTLSFYPSLLFFWEWFVNGQEMIYECIIHFHSCLETWLIKENKLARNVGEWTKRVNWSYISYVVGGGDGWCWKKLNKVYSSGPWFLSTSEVDPSLTLFLSWCHVLVIITFKLIRR